MPPRLQCLNAPKLFRQQNLLSKVAFSISANSLADEPPSSATELLSTIGDSPNHIQFPNLTRRSASNNPNRRKTPQQGNASSNQRVENLINKVTGRAGSRPGSESGGNIVREMKKHKLASDLTRHIHRRWKAGDIYAPHDLTSTEMQKWRKRGKPEYDAFDMLDLNPIEEYKNFSIMSEYITPMGRILSSEETGLRRVNQRRIAKAIRRSIGLGLMPSVHRHPEILYKANSKFRGQIGRMTN